MQVEELSHYEEVPQQTGKPPTNPQHSTAQHRGSRAQRTGTRAGAKAEAEVEAEASSGSLG